MATTDDVAQIARRLCAKFATGYRGGMVIGQIHFELSDIAACSEFVRECCEAAAGTASHGPLTHKYFGGDARHTERKLRGRGTGIGEGQAVPGDIVCFNAGAAGRWGHIGIYLGGQDFAENTSSRRRGPGFVTSTFGQIGRHRISGFYHLPEFARPAELTVIVCGTDLGADAIELRGDETWVALRPLVEAAELTVTWDGATQTVTVTKPEEA